MRLIHQRIQWPVGHGFFHTAKIKNSNFDLNYVYDCGGDDLITIEKSIDDYCKDFAAKKIDLFVISHFHRDHINGIPHLLNSIDVDKIVTPFLNDEEKIISLIELCEAGLQEYEFLAPIIVDFQKWLSLNGREDIKLITISGEAGSNEEAVDIDISNIISGRIDHNRNLVFRYHGDDIWLFKFYVENNSSRRSNFIIELQKEFSFSNLNDFLENFNDSNWIRVNFSRLEKVYKTIVSAKQNSISLCMLSTPKSYYSCDCHWCDCECNVIGWMGTGDIHLKSNARVGNFLRHYGLYINQIDTISIPHHGSLLNYSPSIGVIGFNSVITCTQFPDPTNHHPNNDVLNDLIKNRKRIIVVTSDKSTIHSVEFHIYLDV